MWGQLFLTNRDGLYETKGNFCGGSEANSTYTEARYKSFLSLPFQGVRKLDPFFRYIEIKLLIILAIHHQIKGVADST